MSTPLPAYLSCSPDVVGGLIETVTAALLADFPQVEGDQEDLEMVLDALKVLRPKVIELETLTGLLRMQQSQWDEAIHLFSGVVARAPKFSYAKALLAFCLAFKGDPNWRQAAAEAMQERPDRATRVMVRALAARDDLNEALRAHKDGAPFQIPLSIAMLSEDIDAEPNRGVPPAPVTTAAVQGQPEQAAQPGYLRI